MIEKQNNLSISQNFIKSSKLIESIIREKTSINSQDVVLDIGAGKGVLSFELSKKCQKVIAYELDKKLVKELKAKISETCITNIEVIEGDFLNEVVNVPKYKVFSNIPFSISAEIINKLLLSENPPTDSYIFLEKGAGYRFLGMPYSQESILSMKLKCEFDGEITHQFSKFDFQPIPKADVILVRFKKIDESKTDFDKGAFIEFITRIFDRKKHILKNALETEFSFNQIKRIKRDLGLDLSIPPSRLLFEKWLQIYKTAKVLKLS